MKRTMEKDMSYKDSGKSGEHIRKVRLALRKKQYEFADEMGMGKSRLSEMENSKWKPGYELMRKLVREYKVNPYFLLFGEEPIFFDTEELPSKFSGDDFIINSGDVKEFLHYFRHSKIIQLLIITEFRKKLVADKELIEKEIADKANKKT